MTDTAGGNRYLVALFAAALVEWCKSGIDMVRNVRKHLIRLAMLGTFSSRRRLGVRDGHAAHDRHLLGKEKAWVLGKDFPHDATANHPPRRFFI